MRMTIALGLLALAACSGTEKQEEPEAALTLQAGLWEMGSQIIEVPTPGAPIQVMKAPRTSTYCLKAEQAAKPEPAMFTDAKGKCSYESDHISDGRMVLAFTCKQGNVTSKNPLAARSTSASLEGSYTATTIDATVNLAVYGGGQKDYFAKAKLTGKRVGECAAEQPTPS